MGNISSGVGGELPLYEEIQKDPAELGDDGHKGLWFERFFNGYADGFHALKETVKEQPDIKLQWIQTVVNGQKCPGCREAALRQLALCNNLDGKSAVYAGTWHFATGLGLPHPVENGFLWHPTLGVPYIPGAAVKGLLRAWIEAWADCGTEQARRKKLHAWFGSEDKEPETCLQDSQAGNLIFFDALPVEPVMLKADIMTPHMGEWYEKGGQPARNTEAQAEQTPADWHDPNPIPFLVADKPKFLFSIAPRPGTDMSESMESVMQELGEALDWLGAGAKTAVGYGQFEENKQCLDELSKALRKKNQERDKKRREEIKKREEEQAAAEERANWPPSVRKAIEDYEESGSVQKIFRYIIAEIKDGKWLGTELVEILQWLKSEMKRDNDWKEGKTPKNPEAKKHQNYRDTMFIKQKLEESQTI